MSTEMLVAVVSLVLAAGGGAALKAVFERRGLTSKSNLDDASATASVTAAARELVDPLRKELATERAEHAEQVKAERAKVAEVRAELESALDEARELRNELAMARVEADALRREREVDRATIRELRKNAASS